MKVFVAFGYNENDRWIKDLVFPLIRAFDIAIVTGEDIHGQVIVEKVPELIKQCDGMLAFLTREWHLHPWVRDELVTATALKIHALEIKEAGVQNLGGIVEGRQRIEYDSNRKELLLVELANVLSGWRRQYEVKSLLILPDAMMHEARPHIKAGTLKCYYRFKDGNEESPTYTTIPFRFPQSLGIDVKHIPSSNALIQIEIEGPGFMWSCGYQSFNLVPLNLQKDI